MNKERNFSEMQVRLNSLYQETSGKFWSTLLHCVEDPLRPKTLRNHARIDPVLLLLLVLLALTVATFLAFSWLPR
jgi:hypothetical protein